MLQNTPPSSPKAWKRSESRAQSRRRRRRRELRPRHLATKRAHSGDEGRGAKRAHSSEEGGGRGLATRPLPKAPAMRRRRRRRAGVHAAGRATGLAAGLGAGAAGARAGSRRSPRGHAVPPAAAPRGEPQGELRGARRAELPPCVHAPDPSGPRWTRGAGAAGSGHRHTAPALCGPCWTQCVEANRRKMHNRGRLASAGTKRGPPRPHGARRSREPLQRRLPCAVLAGPRAKRRRSPPPRSLPRAVLAGPGARHQARRKWRPGKRWPR